VGYKDMIMKMMIMIMMIMTVSDLILLLFWMISSHWHYEFL